MRSTNSTTILDGSIEDIIENLELIRDCIPKKSDLTEEEVRDRLANRTYGIKVAREEGSLQGIIVWYEDERDLYMWLGALRKTGNGIGSEIFWMVDEETDYNRWHVKTSVDNGAAKGLLSNFGFRTYRKEGDLLYMQRNIPKSF